jgi:hypothetical protein
MRVLFNLKAKPGYYNKNYYGDGAIKSCELTPGVRSIICVNPIFGGKETKFLSFPYVQLTMVNGSVFASMSKKPIQNHDDLVYPLPLPNCYENLAVCGIQAKDLEHLCKVFWNSKFQGTAYPGNMFLQKSSMKNLNVWQKMTKIAPEFIMSEGCDYGSKAIPLLTTIKNYSGYGKIEFEEIK